MGQYTALAVRASKNSPQRNKFWAAFYAAKETAQKEEDRIELELMNSNNEWLINKPEEED